MDKKAGRKGKEGEEGKRGKKSEWKGRKEFNPKNVRITEYKKPNCEEQNLEK